jgi:hypothetical protein
MKAFSDAGIYIWLDLDTFNTTVVQTNPTWTEDQFLAFTEVMDVFQRYDNLGGFWIGNEVINTATGSLAAPYVKAATTDMKAYMAAKKYREIPIGYSAADIAELRPMLQNYLSCGSKPNQIIDFFGLNSYEWCGTATYESSGYSNLQAMSAGYNIPIFFSETGCNVGGERTFDDQAAIFGKEMVGTWSGSIVYEWVQEVNDYGLVSYSNGQIYSGAPTPIQPDYDNLSKQWKTITPSGVALATYKPSNSPPACPSATLGWQLDGDVPLPTLAPSIISAVAASIKPIATHRPTSSENSAVPTGTVPASTPPIDTSSSTFVTAMSLGLIIYSSLMPGNSKKPKPTSTSSAPGVDLGIVANSEPASLSFSSLKLSLSDLVCSSTSISVTDSVSSTSASTSSTSASDFSTNTPAGSNSGTGVGAGPSSTGTSSSPSPSSSKSAASALKPQPNSLYKVWTAFVTSGGHGGIVGLAIITVLLGTTVAVFL